MFRYIVASGLLTVWAGMAHAVVTLEPSLLSGQLVGTTVIWTATDPDARDFRFIVEDPRGRVMIVRDFDILGDFRKSFYRLVCLLASPLRCRCGDITVLCALRSALMRSPHPARYWVNSLPESA
jgi:hypothetical protein